MQNRTYSDDVARLAIEGPLCVYNVLEYKSRLIDGLPGARVLELDLAAVDEFDSAGFQLLVLVKRESLRLGRRLALVAHSNPVREVIEFYNMHGFFGDPLLIPADQD